MKNLIAFPLFFLTTISLAHPLQDFSEIKKAVTKGKLVRIAVDFVKCSNPKNPSASFHMGLFTPNEMQVMDTKITASLKHFTMNNPKFPNVPTYEFITYTLTSDNNLNLSHEVLDARDYSALSKKFSMNCKMGEGVTVYLT